MYLIQEHQVKTKKLGIMYFRMPSLEVLDDLNFKVIIIGFPLFTLGFMTGSISNMQLNQSFFSWDLTRTLPLVATWLIYSLVFFGRMIVGLRGKKAAQDSEQAAKEAFSGISLGSSLPSIKIDSKNIKNLK